jgi:D-tyrosyl-tRNA(Tyr) deacylase
MRAVLQRVAEASVTVRGERIAAIGRGLLVLLGVARGDTEVEADWMADKIAGLRIFEDAEGRLDASVGEVGGAALLVSQFTLCAETRKGRRLSFTDAAPPELAEPLYERVAGRLAAQGIPVQRGRFGARMQVTLINDGPVTVLVDSPARTAG